MIRRIDHWIGTRLFHPPIIWICQRTGMSQYALAAYAWLAAVFTFVPRLRLDSGSAIIWTIVVSLIALMSTIATALLPDMPRRPSFSIRVLVWIITIFDLVVWIGGYRLHGSDGGANGVGWREAWDAFVLIAEYAKTIDSIPPRKRREPARKAQEART